MLDGLTTDHINSVCDAHQNEGVWVGGEEEEFALDEGDFDKGE